MTDASTEPSQGALSHEEFSLVAGGPLYQLLLRTRLLEPPLGFLRRRVLVITAFAWVPLFVLSLVDGRAFGGVPIPFVEDVDVQVRLLFSLPVLVLAEKIVHERLRRYIRLFVDSEVVRAEERGRFEALVASTLRWRNSVVVEVTMIAFVYTLGHALWNEQLPAHQMTWIATPTESGLVLTLAGQWFGWASMPVFQFILLRWWYRLALWWSFLFRVSRLDLHLVPTHPDRTGGLEFLGICSASFTPLLLAQTSLVSAMVATRILHQGAHLQAFQIEIAAGLLFAMLQVLGPLLVFAPKLAAARREGLHEYGLLSDRYVRAFDRKWVRGGAPSDEPLLGSSDIQSLNDLAGAFEVVSGMRTVPFSKETVGHLFITCALPMLPLLTTVIPVEELVGRLLEALL